MTNRPLLVILSPPGAAMNAAIRQKDTITFDCALKLANAAHKKAIQIQREVAIVILDSGASPLITFRMDRAPLPSLQIAQISQPTFGTPATWTIKMIKTTSPGQQGGTLWVIAETLS